jgi:outer membrane protein assembly factor BamB
MRGSGLTDQAGRRLGAVAALAMAAFAVPPGVAQVPSPSPSEGLPASAVPGSPAPVPETVEAEALFRFPVGGVVTAGPSIAAGKAWLLSDSRTLYVLTVDGVAIGKRTLPERRAAYIVCDAWGRAAVSSGQSGVALVNKAGQEVWRADLGAAPASPPAFASDGRMFVATGKSLSAFAPNGGRLWKAGLPSGPSSPVIIGPGGGPALGLADGTVALYSPDGGGPLLGAAGSEPLALAVSGDRLAAALRDGRLVVFRSDAAGTMLESVDADVVSLGARPLALAASADGFFALGQDGSLLAVDQDGRERWRTSLRLDGGPATLAAFEGRVVVATRSAVRSYGPDGSMYRTLRLSNVVSTPAIAPNGAVFAGGADWILYAYRFERPLAAAPVPAVPPLDMAAVDAMADEEAFWTIAPHSDATATERLLDIEKTLKSGTIGSDARQTALYLSAVALGRMGAPFGSGAAPTGALPSGPLPRVQACGLLGRMGLTLAVPSLVSAFENDPEPTVRAAAAAAVAVIGLDPEGRAMEAFARATERRLDERTAAAIVGAIDALYRASGSLDDRSGLLALVRIAGGDYPRDVRSLAEKALKRASATR